MNKIKCITFACIAVVTFVFASNKPADGPHKDLQSLITICKNAKKIRQRDLPPPYHILLTQPLMTRAIEAHYQRTAIIETLYVIKNNANKSYQRAIRMLVDPNKMRDKPALAQRNHEARVVELAFITLNFAALPKKIIRAVQNTNIPFGNLLLKDNRIKITTKNRSYFMLVCTHRMQSVLGCHVNQKIYGRTNTILNAKNNKWLARVVEILPGS